jgi:group I intron endonuclease
MGCIYKITNCINQKLYIGLTINDAETRFKKHKSMIYSNGCSALYGAFKKYGVENFKVETICFSSNKEELMSLEKYYISELNTVSPNGYNLTSGGENCKVADETKKKISKALKGRKIKWAEKVSIGVKKLWEDEEYRTKQTEQRKQKRGKYRDGIIKPLRLELPSEKINQLYKDGKTINEISKLLGVSFYTIKRRIEFGE